MPKNKDITSKNWVDPDDAPALPREWFQQADVYAGEKLVRRGRPRQTTHKVSLHLRVDPEIAAALRATGKGWQTRLNALLLAMVQKGEVYS